MIDLKKKSSTLKTRNDGLDRAYVVTCALFKFLMVGPKILDLDSLPWQDHRNTGRVRTDM